MDFRARADASRTAETGGRDRGIAGTGAGSDRALLGCRGGDARHRAPRPLSHSPSGVQHGAAAVSVARAGPQRSGAIQPSPGRGAGRLRRHSHHRRRLAFARTAARGARRRGIPLVELDSHQPNRTTRACSPEATVERFLGSGRLARLFLDRWDVAGRAEARMQRRLDDHLRGCARVLASNARTSCGWSACWGASASGGCGAGSTTGFFDRASATGRGSSASSACLTTASWSSRSGGSIGSRTCSRSRARCAC